MDGKPRILGVDDSLTIRKALELVLRPAGYLLDLAATGTEAIEKARGFQPAAILLDFILPDMRGTEVCRRLAADPETAGIPVVLISAKGAEIRQAYQDVKNVVGYITKPFTPETIIEMLADAVKRSRDGVLTKGQPVPAEIQASDQLLDLDPAEEDEAAAELSLEPEPLVAEPAPAEPLSQWDATLEADAGDAQVADECDDRADRWEDEPPSAVEGPSDEARRAALEMMFETLTTGLEGVYVEEVDTSAGASADEAKSYSDLVAQLNRQLGELLEQTRSGARFALCSDGSIRSLDEVLFDAYRRVCRLLFRASTAGAVPLGIAREEGRVLLACHRDSELFTAFRAVADHRSAWRTLLVSERFRQLPIVTRLYGPTHLIVETTGSGALWDQLRVIQALPEWGRLRVAAVLRSESTRRGSQLALPELQGQGIDAVFEHGPRLCTDLLAWIRAPMSSEAPLASVDAPVSAALG